MLTLSGVYHYRKPCGCVHAISTSSTRPTMPEARRSMARDIRNARRAVTGTALKLVAVCAIIGETQGSGINVRYARQWDR